MGRTVKGDTYIMTNFQFTKLLRDANLLSPLFTAGIEFLSRFLICVAAANRVVARQFLKAKGQSNAIYQVKTKHFIFKFYSRLITQTTLYYCKSLLKP